MANEAGPALDFLSGGGELGALIRAKDWSKTSLGPPASWPQSLKTCVRIVLTSRQAMFVWWGAELINIYNDAYKAIVGGKHPQALGQPAALVWREIWDQIGPRAELAMRHNEGTYDEALLLIMERYGYSEETYYTFSYSPVPNDQGGIGGIICANTDDTQRIIAERQLTLLRELAAGTADARSVEEACRLGAGALATNPRDLPFALLYLVDPERRRAVLAGASGIVPGAAAAPREIAIGDDRVWPLSEVLASGETRLLELRDLPAALPTGAWNQPPRQAALVPMAPKGQAGGAGLLIVGLNPYRLFDDGYQRLLGLVAGQLAAALGNAQAYQEERRRAEALAEIDRAKTAFFSNASHEFRTPLTLMLSPLEDMLVRHPTAQSVIAERRELELVHRNGLRLLRLVNTLLDFSRIEAGRLQAAYEPVELGLYTAELASTFRSAMERAGLRFTVDCQPLPAPVYVDRDMWEKIVLNLVSNAFKYTLEGEVAVTLRPGAAGSVELSVRDSGVGIPEHELPRLFERFHRIEGQRGRTQEGTGIGLALVQELVRLHGGTVRVESALGCGACFTVSLPIGAAHLPADRIRHDRGVPAARVTADAFVEEALRWLPGDRAALSAAIDAELPGPAPGTALPAERPVVLLADDNADMRDYVRRLLAGRYEVEAVSDGQAALELAERRRPDLLLSDVMMPRLDGFGLLKALRADSALRDIPVILLSARAGEEAKVEGLEAGADDYLVKPFSARELIARVDANIAMARLRRRTADVLREEARRLEALNRTGTALAAELDLERLVQIVTDNATELTGARFGAFFYNVADERGEAYTLYALSGVPREAVGRVPLPRDPALFEPTFRGRGVVRSDDIQRDPQYGRNTPFHGMPTGHLPVRSYLAVPVVSRSGEVLGGLFFGHPEPAIFAERAELIVSGIAAQAAVAIDNARLYRASQEVQAELRRLNETLEQRVADETSERMKIEEALRQSQKMEAIGQLTGGIAHDFNNLLQVILGNLDALRRRAAARDDLAATSDWRRLTDAAVRGAERAAILTQRLLAFSRRQPLDPKPTDANKLVTGMSDLLRRTLGESIAIETVTAGGLWGVLVDANQLESAILNLAVNSRDAMPGGGKLTIETANAFLDETYGAAHHDVGPGQYVLISVTDSGAGMSKEVIARAFDPFFTTKEVGQGTGLGLSQVYGFVKQSGGHVKIYSERGEGTTVKLYLPRLPVGAAAAETRSAPAPSPMSEAGELVLLVEDDDDVRAATGDMLRELGYGVIVAADGAEALRLLKQHADIELLFTDVGLPGGLNGRQLADAVRALRPTLPVLFTTGYARNAIVHHGRLDPGVELLVKPFTYSSLALKLRQTLKRATATS